MLDYDQVNKMYQHQNASFASSSNGRGISHSQVTVTQTQLFHPDAQLNMVNPQVLRMFGKSTVDQLNQKYENKLPNNGQLNHGQNVYNVDDEIPYEVLSQYPTK